jgi:hypothetical protein
MKKASRNPKVIAKQKEMMIHNVEVFYGNVRKACNAVGLSTQTHYRWTKEDSEYGARMENLKDISFRNLKERLVESALNRIDKGDSVILGKMLALFLSDLPEEMKAASRANRPQTVAVMKYVDTREEAQAIMERQRIENQQRAVDYF